MKKNTKKRGYCVGNFVYLRPVFTGGKRDPRFQGIFRIDNKFGYLWDVKKIEDETYIVLVDYQILRRVSQTVLERRGLKRRKGK